MEYINETKTEVTRVIEEWIDEKTGIKHRQVSKSNTDKPIELGSINKPKNENIIRISITVPKNNNKKIDIKSFFDLFK